MKKEEMKTEDVQTFAALGPEDTKKEAVSGKDIVYLFRPYAKRQQNAATVIAFQTEGERTITKDADTTETKSGPIRTPGATEIEISCTAVLSKKDTTYKDILDAMLKDELVECWRANLAETSDGSKFKGTYYQGYITEFSDSASSEDKVEVSITFGANGTGADGEVTVPKEQQELANYVFADTVKAGA